MTFVRSKKVLVDAHARTDFGLRNWGYQTPERAAAALEREAADFNAFIKDHRSRDQYHVTIKREYKDMCAFGCKYEAEDDPETGEPACCDAALDAWKAHQATMTTKVT